MEGAREGLPNMIEEDRKHQESLTDKYLEALQKLLKRSKWIYRGKCHLQSLFCGNQVV